MRQKRPVICKRDLRLTTVMKIIALVAIGEERELVDERSEDVNLLMTRPLQKFTKVSALVLLESKSLKRVLLRMPASLRS
jgi:hypothetical protein